jgi:hypothetical protein
MLGMSEDTIYIELIDGARARVPVKGVKLNDNQFRILDDYEFRYSDPLHLFEFYPGDVVEVEDRAASENKKVHVANKLVQAGEFPDRKYNEFKFLAAVGHLPLDQQTAQYYRDEIARIKREIASGQFFYKTLLETIGLLDKLDN